MTEEDRLRRIEKLALLAACVSLATAHEQHRQGRWKRRVKDALWPLL